MGVRLDRWRRRARVGRLTVRRGAHWLVTQVRGRRADEARRAELEERFAIRTAEDVARELGNMKGAIMKAGQMISFIAEGLPPEAQAALATLQADVPPMAPSLAEGVIRAELGDEPDRLFLAWDPVPIDAAATGLGSQSRKSLSGSAPSSSRTTASARLGAIGGVSCWRLASAACASGGRPSATKLII